MGRFFLLSALLATSPAVAEQAFDSQPLVKKDTLHASISFGYGGIENPIKGAENITTPVLPSLAYYSENWFFDNFAMGYSIAETQNYYIDITTRFNSDGFFFELDGIDKLFVAGPVNKAPTRPNFTPPVIFAKPIERDLSYLGGVAIGFKAIGDIWFEFATLQDISGVHHGHEIQLNGYHSMAVGRGIISLEGGVIYKSNDVIEYYYRIAEEEVISQLPRYDLDSSVNYHVNVNYQYPLNPDWSVDVKLKHTWLGSGVRNSPMLDESAYFSGFAGIKYTF